MDEQLPPAGWYADPDDASQQRYWDGNAWTEHVAPGAAQGSGTTVFSGGTGDVQTWTWQSIVATILCCNIIGVVGVLNAGRAEQALRNGDTASANRYASSARTWTLWAAGIYLVLVALFVLLFVGGIVSGSDTFGGSDPFGGTGPFSP